MRNQYLGLKIKLFIGAVIKGKITFRKLWNTFLTVVAYWRQSPTSAGAPFILSIELWNECNAGCLFCRNEKGEIFDINPQSLVKTGVSKGKMPVAMACDIISQFKEDSLIAVLYTNGEPLLYPELPQVIRHANDNKMLSMISTNGLLFTEENAAAILSSGIDFIKIQLGGFTQDIYSIQIRYGQVEKLKENIRMLTRLRNEGKYQTVILIDWITYNYNRHQLPLIQAFCKELGLMLSYRPGNPKGGLEHLEPKQSTELLPLNISCDWLWQGMQFNFNGEILQCCEGVVWSELKPYATIETGKTDLKAVWNGKAAQSMRQTMSTKGRGAISLCAKCERKGVCFKW